MQIRLRRFDSDLSLQNEMVEKFNIDFLVVGGGISGIAIASEISKSGLKGIVIEKNNKIAEETSSRNSEVIHAGIYYKEGSLKSKLCIEGKKLLYEHLEKHDIPHLRCGKFILSTSDSEQSKLEEIYKNANDCGVTDLVYNDQALKQYDFLNFKSSLFSPSTGIFDSHSFIESLKSEFEDNEGIVLVGNEMIELDEVDGKFEILIKDTNNFTEFIITTNNLINCAGLNAHNIINSFLDRDLYKPKYQKGEYYSYLGKEKLRHLIYPLPSDLSLGIHATIDLGTGIRFGPSSYTVTDLDYTISSEQRNDFHLSVKKYWPGINIDDLVPSYTGIRPLLEDINDFLIDTQLRNNSILVSILGYASPGLTSSLALAKEVSKEINVQ